MFMTLWQRDVNITYKNLKTIHIKSHNIEKNPFLYYLIQVPVHVYSNHWNIYRVIKFLTPHPLLPTIAPPKKTLPPKIMKNYHCYTDSTDKTMVYVNVNNIRDKMPLFYCIDHVMFLWKELNFSGEKSNC